jgi:hypothetical protein
MCSLSMACFLVLFTLPILAIASTLLAIYLPAEAVRAGNNYLCRIRALFDDFL